MFVPRRNGRKVNFVRLRRELLVLDDVVMGPKLGHWVRHWQIVLAYRPSLIELVEWLLASPAISGIVHGHTDRGFQRVICLFLPHVLLRDSHFTSISKVLLKIPSAVREHCPPSHLHCCFGRTRGPA